MAFAEMRAALGRLMAGAIKLRLVLGSGWVERRGLRLAIYAGLLLSVPLFLVLGLPADVLARGGGGSHSGGSGGGGGSGGFGGGSGGSGGFGGGGGSGGDGSFVFLPFIFGDSGSEVVTMIFIVGMVAYGIYRLARAHPKVHDDFRPDDEDEYTVTLDRPLHAAGPEPAVLAGVESLKATDPAFDTETFLQRAEMAFLLVKRAYQDRNVAAGRAFMAPELWQSWSRDVQQLLAQGRRPMLENLNVRGMQVPFVAHGPGGDTIQVHFDYVAAVYLVDATSGQVVSGSDQDERLGELWTFQRGSDAKTVVSGGVTASKCPNCGGLLELDDDGRCNYCGADIPSGRYDWVVVRMDRDWFRGASTAASFGAAEMDPVSGMATIKQADPSFDEQAFLGRVRQAFFALQQAWQERDLSASRPFMSPGLYLGWSSQVQQLIDLHKRNVLEGLRIDHHRTVKVVHGSAFDNVTVRVKATCADYEVDERTGRMIFGSREPSQFTEYWTFQRSIAAQTTGRSILDKVCPNCGAPLEINQVGECRYCDAAVTSGRFDWVLSRIEQEETYAG